MTTVNSELKLSSPMTAISFYLSIALAVAFPFILIGNTSMLITAIASLGVWVFIFYVSINLAKATLKEDNLYIQKFFRDEEIIPVNNLLKVGSLRSKGTKYTTVRYKTGGGEKKAIIINATSILFRGMEKADAEEVLASFINTHQ